MVFVKKTELNKILKDYKNIQKFLSKNKLISQYVKTNKVTRAHFTRRSKLIDKMIKAKVR